MNPFPTDARVRRRRWVGVCCGLALLGPVMIWAGIELRRWAWEQTTPVRFLGDIQNGFHWGGQACDAGYLNLYDNLVRDRGEQGNYRLDYTPLRLGVMTAWVAWQRRTFPGIEAWINDYAHTWPLLWFNAACELAAAAGVFALVRVASRGHGQSTFSKRLQGLVLASLAAAALWFNPAVIWNAHCWPQWDIWCVPFFLWALWSAAVNRWMLAGVLIAVGAMLKGQVLLVAPVLLVWPLVSGQWTAAVRGVAGLALGTAMVVSPWLVRTWSAAAWLGLLVIGGGVLLDLLARRYRIQTATRNTLLAMGFTAALWLTAFAHQASFAWYRVGFAFPQRHHNHMSIGPASNLAAILHGRYEWSLADTVELGWLGWRPSVRMVLISLYAVTLLTCGWRAAHFDRRRDPRWLLAVIGPWVFMFLLMPQMHERYLLWAAACSAAWVALGVGPALLHLTLTAAAWSMMAQPMFGYDRAWAPGWFEALRRTHPDKAWGLLVLAAVLMVMICTPGRRADLTPPSASEAPRR